MKTITLEGTLYKFDNLRQATSKFDEDRLPYLVETRVYVVNQNVSDIYVNGTDNEEFMKIAEEQGRVYTLQGFQEAFNNEEVNTNIDVIRFINVMI